MPLAEVGAGEASELARELDRLSDDLDLRWLVSFAPEMNGSWQPWGQQLTDFVTAYRAVAEAVDATTAGAAERVASVWAPADGAGYPFGAAYGQVDGAAQDGAATDPALDTTGDGELTAGDDPYGPYYPGDDVVDWVGLSSSWFGPDGSFGDDVVPPDGTLAARLAAPVPAGDGRASGFVERYAVPGERPLLLRTGALANTERTGADELAVKRAWWRQVLALADPEPALGAVSWLEQRRAEDEAGGDVVDWRATADDELARALRADLAASAVSLEPVSRVLDQETSNTAVTQAWSGAGAVGGEGDGYSLLSWLALSAGVLAAVFVAAGVVGRLRPSWAYAASPGSARDDRLDLFRGFIILAVVITHVELAGPYSYVTVNALGAITGAEMFVLLSGVVLGMVWRPTVAKVGAWAASVAMWKRARKLYLTTLTVVALVYLVGLLPLVDTSVVTTFTDRGTGTGGDAVAGQVYDLYPNVDALLRLPPEGYAVRQFLLLQMGPWVFNIMGLFVVLSLVTPLAMRLVDAGRWWLLLATSWALYAWEWLADPDLLPSQLDDVFPLLAWQVAFAHGLVLGHHRARVTAALTSRLGLVVTSTLVVGYALALGWLWLAAGQGLPTPLPGGEAEAFVREQYTRVLLRPGRLVDLAFFLVVAYAVLTRCWQPLHRAFGWFYEPLGRASLYVFVVHVPIVVVVGNLPGLDRSSWWQGLVLHTAALALVWVLVKRRVLFPVIPQ
ncbi:OpgC domain-containing protein [Nocardioides perillae]|uniref:GH26 domain-containing protein n=1 Tax=Nocardioides perillae TaxID=1119534 RepID=A0A7Y9RUV0_9ACTN|nr:hypothetical protein [Nocardioides perillae]